MKNVFLITCIVAISFHSKAQVLPDSVRTFAEKEVQEFAKDYPGVSVSVSLDGSIIWNKTMGFSNINRKNLVTRNTKFNIYSTSKLITGLAYLKLIHSGQLSSLNVRVCEIDPDLPHSYKNIEVRHLLTHTSGIRHYKSDEDWRSFSNLRCENPAEALKYFINDPLEFEPGEKELYTTFGMVLASHLLEKMTGLKYIDAINNLLPFTKKLLLDNENINKATPYKRVGEKYEEIMSLSAECKYAGGGLIASSVELVEAGQIFYSDSFIPFNELKKLIKSQYSEKNPYGGISFAMGTYSKGEILNATMGGASPGGRSYLLIYADLKVAIAITTNCQGDGEKSLQLSRALAKKFAGLN